MPSSLSKPFTAFILTSKPEGDTVIDLTGDDGNVELKCALEASLSTYLRPNSVPVIGHSRAIQEHA